MKPPKAPELSSPSTRAWWGCPGILYFLAVGPEPHHVAVKIGVAAQTRTTTLKASLKRRLDQIQSSNHEPILLLGLIYFEKEKYEYPMWHADTLERKLHNEFQHLARFTRDTRGSEWFTSAPALLARIKEISVPPERLGLPRSFCKPISLASA
jgi:hypothetical protein